MSTWTRVLLAALAVPQLVTGLWAVVNPENFYSEFPGFGPMLVAAEPPFNAHLTSDTGAGFLATGVAALLAAMWGERRAVLVAGSALVAFAVPHLLHHAFNPSPGLTDTQNVVDVVVLAVAAALPVAVVLAAAKPRKGVTP